MDVISLGGRSVAGFALGAGGDGSVSPAYAAVMTGTAAGLLAYVLRAPVWGAVVVGAGAAIVTKASIDRAA